MTDRDGEPGAHAMLCPRCKDFRHHGPCEVPVEEEAEHDASVCGGVDARCETCLEDRRELAEFNAERGSRCGAGCGWCGACS